MWFLSTDTLLLLTVFSLLTALLRKMGVPPFFLPLAGAAVLTVISPALAAFSVVYALIVWLLTAALFRAARFAKLLMGLFCLLAVSPLFAARLLTLPFALIGFAFTMLKALDALYYVYYGKEKVKPAVLFGYLLFLPVFTAGPVFRYRDFLHGYENPAPLTAEVLRESILRSVRGMFKKVVLVSLATQLFTHLRGLEGRWFLSLGLTVLSYAILYLDLSGYSDMAIAYSAVCGFSAPENFKKPWLAPTCTQFWRSWHASVSDFIREHIYVVVSKKKLTPFHSGLIGFSVMVMMALWHDFNLIYLIAGCYNGILLMLENFVGKTTVRRKTTPTPVFFLRCTAVNFLFALNTLVFTLPPDGILPVLRGFLRW
ncbi:MAG: hypothetical protein LBR72_00925 [Oscillospiraceae bacterium]|jgi:alginate O-acetyltransferase complex protein AlgI|nr:hypothetical protein [Oscillospiraceae bacterium]